VVLQAVIATLVLVAAAAGGVFLVRVIARELRALRTDTSEQLTTRTAEVDRRLLAIDEKLDRRLADLDTKVDRRLETASKTTAEIHERLGKVHEATGQVLEQAKAFGRLEQALRPPKARGGFGELLLENLLRDRLPHGSFELQYGFSTGERVDAVLHVERLVPIDAKFPFDNFERLASAESDDERTLYEKAFARDLRGHVDAIASKYIRPDEGTYDFALMYLPSEGVYYELVCGKTGALLQYAHEKRVFPVSPTTFTAQLQVIALGLKGLQIEQHAHEVMAYVAQLGNDFDRFRTDFEVVGKHLGNAQSKYAEAEKRLDRFETKLERATEQDELDDGASAQVALDLPRALDAA
jgi:DNA recombination protein RmuC